MSLMIIEDKLAARNLLNKYLSFLGYKIIALAQDGQDAIEIFENLSEKPEIIIIDQYMPRMTGMEVAEILLKHHASLKIILISGDKNLQPKAEALGIHSFLEKPFELSTLKQQIEALLS